MADSKINLTVKPNLAHRLDVLQVVATNTDRLTNLRALSVLNSIRNCHKHSHTFRYYIYMLKTV